MLITPHFSLDEFDLPDEKARRYGLSGALYPTEWIDSRLRPLCKALEAVREAFGRPITVISGYRTPAYNAARDGAPQSQHLEGRAADFTVAETSPARVYRKILDLYGVGALEIGGAGLYPPTKQRPLGFVHLDVRGGPLVTWTR